MKITIRKLALIALLSGTIAAVHAEGAPDQPSDQVRTIWGDAGKQTPVSGQDAGLIAAKTVFVPGRYTQSKNGALFINGSRVVIPGRKTDILGFIRAGDGYVVANYDPNGVATRVVDNGTGAIASLMSPEDIARLTPEQKLRLIEAQAKMSGATSAPGAEIQSTRGEQIQFYAVDGNGQVKSLIRSVNTDAEKVLVTESALYVSQPASRWNEAVPLHSYTGVDAKQAVVNGPQDVIYGTPTADGSWFVTRPIKGERPSVVYSAYVYYHYKWRPDGNLELLRKDSDKYTSLNEFINTTGIFIDSPNLADSIRVGYVMYAHGETQTALAPDLLNFVITPYSFVEPLPKRTQIDCFGLCNHEVSLLGHHPIRATSKLGSDSSTSKATAGAREAAGRAALFRLNGKTTLATQQDGKNGLYYELVSLPSREISYGYQLMGGGVNFVRALVGSNGNDLSFHRRNDVFAIYTPKGTVLIRTENAGQDPNAAVYLESGRNVAGKDVGDFVTRYGLDTN